MLSLEACEPGGLTLFAPHPLPLALPSRSTLEQKLQLETFELLEHLNASISRLQSSASEDQMSILDRMVAEIGSLKSRHSEFQAEWTQCTWAFCFGFG